MHINMENRFEEVMANHSDEELVKIINSEPGDYQPEAIKAAHKEIQKRKIDVKQVGTEPEEVVEESNYPSEETTSIRYPALRFISGFYKILAWIVVIVTVVFIISLIARDGSSLGILEAVIALLGGGFLFISFLATSEIIKVFVDIEHNTRISSMK